MIELFSRLLFGLLCSLLVLPASASQKLSEGMWRGILQLNDSMQLPFNFEVRVLKSGDRITFINAEERIIASDVKRTADSIFIRMPVYDSEFRCKVYRDSLVGKWINHSRRNKNVIPFKAFYNESYRFRREAGAVTPGRIPLPVKDYTGKWEVTFNPGTKNSYKAIGDFTQLPDNKLQGTFLTATGDYRYLEGDASFFGLRLSHFNGAFAFLFTALSKQDSLIGHFWSGAHGYEKWIAVKNSKYKLPDADSLTFLKPGYERMDFSFPNTEGKQVSLADERYKNKVVIVQVMGSWCPNCMDETAYLAQLHKKYKEQGLEVIALSFERTQDMGKAAANLNRVKKHFGAEYEFLLTGKTGKEAAAEILPMLNHVMAFPTTIFIDKSGKVRHIHTGFSGPGTGDAYEELTREIEKMVKAMLKE
jgi:peroxiredoxin